MDEADIGGSIRDAMRFERDVEPSREFGLVQVFPLNEWGIRLGWSLTEGATVGREGTGIRLNHPSVANVHAVFERLRGHLYLRNVDGTETYLNGSAVDERRALVSSGSVVRFGDAICIVNGEQDDPVVPVQRMAGADLGLEGDSVVRCKTGQVVATRRAIGVFDQERVDRG
ncbi:MAG: FHA domain-containing protein [Polyangiaceae bacterium]